MYNLFNFLILALITIIFYIYFVYKRMIRRIEKELEKKIDISKLLYEKQLPIK